MTLNQETIILAPPQEQPTATVILLHGLGATAKDILPIATMIQQANRDMDAFRFVLPTAPTMPVTLNSGVLMPAWYDIINLNPPHVDCKGVDTALRNLDQLIHQEIYSGIAAHRVILMGFSQGGSLVLAYGLVGSQQIGGIVGLSCFLPPCDRYVHQANRTTPILLTHGIYDDVVPLLYAKQSGQEFADYDYELKTYPHAHHIVQQQVNDIAHWINNNIKEAS